MHSTARGSSLLVPEGTCLLHIGPPKTGTTGLQQALYMARDAMRDQGVGHPSRTANPASAVNAVIGRRSRSRGAHVPSIRLWRRLARDVRRAREPRVVLSSEMFADARPETIPTIVDDLGPSRLHVVVTLRPLASILPSQWQQYIQTGTVASYDRWLGAMLAGRPSGMTPSFWRRHRHDDLIARWASVVGPDNVTVVAVDARDHEFIHRTFEDLLGLRRGTLRESRERINRSLSMPEAEALRAFNVAFRSAGLGRDLHGKVIAFGAAPYLKLRHPDPSEPPIETPQWALARAGEIAREMVDHIAASRVRVVGDLDALAQVPAAQPASDHRPPVTVAPEIAARMSLGIAMAAGIGRRRAGRRRAGRGWPGLPLIGRGALGRTSTEPPELGRFPTYVLAGVLAVRGRQLLIRYAERLRLQPTGWGRPRRPSPRP